MGLKLLKCTLQALVISLFAVFTSNFAQANSKITSYFNHNELNSYTDPYRNITRRGDNLEEVIVSHILKAKKSVYIAIQELRLPGIAKALKLKAKEGLDVRLILENDYNFDISSISLYSSLAGDHDASRFVEFFALVDMNSDGKISIAEKKERDAIYIVKNSEVKIKDDTYDGTSGSGLMHHKFIIIDGYKVVMSTANFTMSGVHGDMLHRSTRGNANSMIVAHSRNLAKIFEEEFSIMWGDYSGKSLFGMKKPYRGKQSTTINGSKVTVQFSPTSKSLDYAKSVNGLIASRLATANYEIIAALFVFSEQNLANILKNKYENYHDFKIGTLVEPKFAYRRFSELLDMWGIQLLDEKCRYEEKNSPWEFPVYNTGVPTLTQGDMLHHKYAVVDESMVIVGSQNWSSSANHLNDEFVAVIENEKIALKYKKEFLRLERNSRKGPPKTLLRKISAMESNCF